MHAMGWIYEQMRVSVVVQIYPWFKFYLPFVLGYGNVDNEFETMPNKI